MGTFDSAVVIVVGLLVAGAGVLAAVTGQAPGWLEGTVTRPRVWGAGIALLGLFAVSVSRPLLSWAPASAAVGEVTRAGLILIGLALLWRGRS
ncbi:hypothetical protein ACFWOT_15375 [Streptomyces sp. NPDC058440]|uniref:hypothetical protein n=1 Tax=Streptomyces sp. NPDC058440 TaxID=3346501 RepID=UPI003649426B